MNRIAALASVAGLMEVFRLLPTGLSQVLNYRDTVVFA